MFLRKKSWFSSKKFVVFNEIHGFHHKNSWFSKLGFMDLKTAHTGPHGNFSFWVFFLPIFFDRNNPNKHLDDVLVFVSQLVKVFFDLPVLRCTFDSIIWIYIDLWHALHIIVISGTLGRLPYYWYFKSRAHKLTKFIKKTQKKQKFIHKTLLFLYIKCALTTHNLTQVGSSLFQWNYETKTLITCNN